MGGTIQSTVDILRKDGYQDAANMIQNLSNMLAERSTSTFTLVIHTGGAAFHDDDPECDEEATISEVVRILEDVQDKLEEGVINGSCHDANGNTVGGWSLQI